MDFQEQGQGNQGQNYIDERDLNIPHGRLEAESRLEKMLTMLMKGQESKAS